MKRFPQSSRMALLDRDGGPGGVNWTIRLFSDPVPVFSDTTTISDITECNYSGYAPLTSSGWSVADVDANGIAFRESPLLTFTHDGGIVGQTVRGAYVTWTDGFTTSLLMIDKFASGLPMFNDLDSVPVKVRIDLRQLA